MEMNGFLECCKSIRRYSLCLICSSCAKEICFASFSFWSVHYCSSVSCIILQKYRNIKSLKTEIFHLSTLSVPSYFGYFSPIKSSESSPACIFGHSTRCMFCNLKNLDPTAFPDLCQRWVRPAFTVTGHNNSQQHLNKPTVSAPIYPKTPARALTVIWLFPFSPSTEKEKHLVSSLGPNFSNISEWAAVTCSRLYRTGSGLDGLILCSAAKKELYW